MATRNIKNCENCGNSIYDPQWGEYKCYIKKRYCAPTEKEHGCSDWSEKRGVKVEKIDGATFTPSMSANGDLSWTNNKGLPNPKTVNIRGPVGPQGAPGEPGKDGSDGKDGYSPVKGTDYFTPEEKQEIINEVLRDFPKYNGEVIEV